MSKMANVVSEDKATLFSIPILRVEQVAKVLDMKKSGIYRLVSQKKIPFRKRGKTLFFMTHEIVDWVNEGVT